MEVRLEKILGKQIDYKICKKCDCLNWYENETCHFCLESNFKENGTSIDNWINNELDFWITEGNYTENEAFNIEIEV